MAKLTRDSKIEIYEKRKSGFTFKELALEYIVNPSVLKYLVRLIDVHGVDILRKDSNRTYSIELKQEIINKVLKHGQSINETSIEFGLPSARVLKTWISSYEENNYVIVEKKKGRKPTTMSKNNANQTEINYDSISDQEKIKYLEELNSKLKKNNLNLEAEAEYLKKLNAVVQQRKQLQRKK